MYEAIKNFNKQFNYEPKVENAEGLKLFKKFVVVGMGGSHLAADILKAWDPALDMIIRSDYDLPSIPPEEDGARLFILSSYSGNTEESISAFHKAGEKNLPRAVIAVGGQLLDLAQKTGVPYIQIPDTGIQPRSALGFSLMAFLKLMGQEEALKEASELSSLLQPTEFEEQGRELALRLKGSVPVFYASDRNVELAKNWKIKFNETGKIPAFFNVFPELNHNEMSGFDVKETTAALSKNFYFILLEDESDHPKIKKRMQVTAKLYKDRSLRIESVKLVNHKNVFYKIFSSTVLADWAAYHTAKSYGLDPEQVPIVEEFKKLIR